MPRVVSLIALSERIREETLHIEIVSLFFFFLFWRRKKRFVCLTTKALTQKKNYFVTENVGHHSCA